jgi:hypothetical protein
VSEPGSWAGVSPPDSPVASNLQAIVVPQRVEEGKSRAGNQDIATLTGQQSHGMINGPTGTTRQENIVLSVGGSLGPVELGTGRQ